MQAMALALPTQIHHLSTSMLNTRLSLWAQVIAMDGMYAGLAGAKTGHRRMTMNRGDIRCFGPATLAPLCRCHQRTEFAVRGEYTEKTCQIDSRLGYQCGQFGNEIYRLKDDMDGAIPIRRFQLVSDLTLVRQ